MERRLHRIGDSSLSMSLTVALVEIQPTLSFSVFETDLFFKIQI